VTAAFQPSTALSCLAHEPNQRCPASGLIVLFLVLHILRGYLTGGFLKPREVTWLSGVLLALVVVSLGVSGYSLPWDQVAYWACKIVTSVPEALDTILPSTGSQVVVLLRGSWSTVTQATLSRFYSMHTLLLPLVALVGMVAHFSMLRKQGIGGPL